MYEGRSIMRHLMKILSLSQIFKLRYGCEWRGTKDKIEGQLIVNPFEKNGLSSNTISLLALSYGNPREKDRTITRNRRKLSDDLREFLCKPIEINVTAFLLHPLNFLWRDKTSITLSASARRNVLFRVPYLLFMPHIFSWDFWHMLQ